MIKNSFIVHFDNTLLQRENLKKEDCLFFDIETTGLSWRRSHMYLLGAVYWEKDHWTLTQWFCQKPSEEEEVLTAFSTLLDSHKCLIHFNGSSFDIPYIMHKFTMYELEHAWDTHTRIDLYHKFSPYKKLMSLEHMRQKDLECAAGLIREDTYSGKDLIAIYQTYLNTGDEDLLRLLLLHNREDVEGMLYLTSLHAMEALFQGGNQIRILEESTSQTSPSVYRGADIAAEMNIPADNCIPDKPNIPADNRTPDDTAEPEVLTITCHLEDSVPCRLQYSSPEYSFSVFHTECRFTIPIYTGTLKLFFPDYKNYYYLPLEDTAIHKSVGMYVDKDHRERAKAETCYRKLESRFLIQYETLFSPALKEQVKSAVSYFTQDTWNCAALEQKTGYLTHLLRHALQGK